MPIFKCAKCGCAENTALGWYWAAKILEDSVDWAEIGEKYKGKPLCSECAPKYYKNGQPTGFGKWHGHFKKEPYKE